MNKIMHRSVRGKPIDFDSLQASSPSRIAVGNARYNSRGDKLGSGGKISKTAQQIEDEISDTPANTSFEQNANIKNNLDELKNARSKWVNTDPISANPDDALNILEAVDLLNNTLRQTEQVNDITDKKKNTSKTKRIISDE